MSKYKIKSAQATDEVVRIFEENSLNAGFYREYLEKEYQRDSMGVQNDIFFPEFRRCEERYGVKTTWYTDEREEIKKYSNAMFAYYLEGIVEGNNEIGTLNNYSLKREVDSPFDNRLVLWNSDFEWTDKLTDSVCIPYRALTEKKYQNIIFHDKGICRGMGLNTVFTDISPFLYETDEKKQERWMLPSMWRIRKTLIGNLNI